MDIDPIVLAGISAALLVVILVWSVSGAASRLDRLHKKVEATRAVLDGQLVRRASVTVELCASGLVDPVTGMVLGEAAWTALNTHDGGRASLGAGATSFDGSDGSTATMFSLEQLMERVSGIQPGQQHSRELAESELSRALRLAFDDPDGVAELRDDVEGDRMICALAQSWYRVGLARRFHNDAVAQIRRVRRKYLVRVLRLAGHAELPEMFEMDDTLPDALVALQLVTPTTGRE